MAYNITSGNYLLSYAWTSNTAATNLVSGLNGVYITGTNATTGSDYTVESYFRSLYEGGWVINEPQPETPVQRAARELRAAEERRRAEDTAAAWARQAAARRIKMEVVSKRAAELLLQHLSEVQRRTWLADRYFDVRGASGRTYRLVNKDAHNVFLLDQFSKPVREYCAYSKDPDGILPIEDNLFAQMLTLQFDERAFLAKANTWDLLQNRLFVGQGADAPRLD